MTSSFTTSQGSDGNLSSLKASIQAKGLTIRLNSMMDACISSEGMMARLCLGTCTSANSSMTTSNGRKSWEMELNQ